MQLERARVKYLVKGELESGTEAVALDAPREKGQEMNVEEKAVGNVDVERENVAGKEEKEEEEVTCGGKEG